MTPSWSGRRSSARKDDALLETHIGEDFGKTSIGEGVDDQIADIERILREGQKGDRDT